MSPTSSSNRRALAQWRGYWEPKPRPDRSKQVGDVVGGVLQKMGLGERLKETEVMEAWAEIVGGFLAQHSKPVSLTRGVLNVQVLQSTVHYELERVWKHKIISQMQERFGAKVIRDIRFRL